MRSYLSAILHELRYLKKTPPALMVLFIAPLLYPFMYNYIYVNKFETKVPVVVIDLDKSSRSRLLIRALDATEQLHVIGTEYNVHAVRSIVESGLGQGVFIIPNGFERDLTLNIRPVIRAFTNNTRFMISSDVGKGLSEAIYNLGLLNIVTTFQNTGICRDMAYNLSQPIVPRSEGLANTNESYGDFIIPALLLLVLQQSLFAGCAIASAGMGRAGRKLPPQTGIIIGILGRATPYAILYTIYAFLFFSFQYRLWHIPFNGNIGVIATLTFVHLATMISAGFLVGSFCRSHLSAFLITMFSSYPLFLLSGIAWPTQAMPEVLQILRNVLPSTHYFPAALAAARLGAGWPQVQLPLLSLSLILGTLFTLLIVKTTIMKYEK